jgi:multidrug efflux pump subunit AcrB
MTINNHRMIVLTACVSLFSGSLLATDALSTKFVKNAPKSVRAINQNPKADLDQNQLKAVTETESDRHKKIEREEEMSGKVGYSGFEKQKKTQ